MKKKGISYAKWGYIFMIPFFVVYIVFSLYPLIATFYNSTQNYVIDTGDISKRAGWYSTATEEEEEEKDEDTFVGLENYKKIFSKDETLVQSFKNTIIVWVLGFIPQIVVSLILAVWFTDLRLQIKAQGFFKAVIYLPNVIMASAIALLFYNLLDKGGSFYSFFNNFTPGSKTLLEVKWGARGTIGFINFLLWYGNTTILLMAAIMGVDTSLYESASIDGATPTETFWKITIPLIRPILSFVLVTSMIGGLQMYDVPALLTNDTGKPAAEYANGKPYLTTKTIIMEIQTRKDSDVGKASAVCVIIFFISAIVGFALMYVSADKDGKKKKKKGARG
ncbi:MAG: sugar ABC transporter permease [Ruminococcus sp.]|nr:sugar ABC transporter permease [Ruminococcus sp.]